MEPYFSLSHRRNPARQFSQKQESSWVTGARLVPHYSGSFQTSHMSRAGWFR